MDDQTSHGRLRRAASGSAELLATLAVIAVVVGVLVAGRATPPAGAAETPPPLALASGPDGSPAEPGAAATASPDPSPSLVPPSVEPATEPPTAQPTPDLTPAPTERPARTTHPTATPTPRPTPVIHLFKASGSFGETLVVKGIAVRVVPTEPDPSLLRLCVTDDPEMQGWTELRAYRLTMTWPHVADAEEPWAGVGAHPYNVLNFDPPVASGVTTTVTLCHRPEDTERVQIGLGGKSGPDEILVEYYLYFSWRSPSRPPGRLRGWQRRPLPSARRPRSRAIPAGTSWA